MGSRTMSLLRTREITPLPTPTLAPRGVPAQPAWRARYLVPRLDRGLAVALPTLTVRAQWFRFATFRSAPTTSRCSSRRVEDGARPRRHLTLTGVEHLRRPPVAGPAGLRPALSPRGHAAVVLRRAGDRRRRRRVVRPSARRAPWLRGYAGRRANVLVAAFALHPRLERGAVRLPPTTLALPVLLLGCMAALRSSIATCGSRSSRSRPA